MLKSNGPIFNKFSGFVGRWKGLITWYITVIPQGMLPWQLIFDAKLAKMNGMNFSALCRNVVRLCQVTLEFTMLKVTTFAAIWRKVAYHAKYFRISLTDLYQISRLGRHIVSIKVE